MSITLLVADDHELVRSGIVSLLENTGIDVVAEAATGSEVVEKTREYKPDVVLLDIRLQDGDGLTALE
jgi:DNA-binding NarL/FixJ family response regulator